MPYGLYISAEGATAQNRRLEVLANNLANVDTNGFKRQLAVFQARNTEALERGQDVPGAGSVNDIGGGIEWLGAVTDFSVGPLKNSRFPTDFAINGDGFFAIQKGDQMLLTRAGNFSFNESGVLVTEDGYPVLSDAGTEIKIDVEAGPWTFQADGTIVQDGADQSLAIMRPRSLGDLVQVGENNFKPFGPTTPIAAEERQVLQGFVEGSGVKATQEMMELIETSRAFEANTNMIRNQDQMISNLLSRVLKET